MPVKALGVTLVYSDFVDTAYILSFVDRLT